MTKTMILILGPAFLATMILFFIVTRSASVPPHVATVAELRSAQRGDLITTSDGRVKRVEGESDNVFVKIRECVGCVNAALKFDELLDLHATILRPRDQGYCDAAKKFIAQASAFE